MTVHLPLASHAGVFRRARPSSLVGRDERRAPLKTPAWEANLPRDSIGQILRYIKRLCMSNMGFRHENCYRIRKESFLLVRKIGKSYDLLTLMQDGSPSHKALDLYDLTEK